jgi:hypothetical protein
MLKQIKQWAPPIGVIAFIGGCSALQIAPQHHWASSVIEDTKRRPESICVGRMKVAELSNPVSWFWTPTDTVYIVTDGSRKIRRDEDIYYVDMRMISYDDIPVQYIQLYDISNKKISYVGSNSKISTTDEETIQNNIENPKWEPYRTPWNKNIDDWIRGGKRRAEKYCL